MKTEIKFVAFVVAFVLAMGGGMFAAASLGEQREQLNAEQEQRHRELLDAVEQMTYVCTPETIERIRLTY